jgi:hypothetical protein
MFVVAIPWFTKYRVAEERNMPKHLGGGTELPRLPLKACNVIVLDLSSFLHIYTYAVYCVAPEMHTAMMTDIAPVNLKILLLHGQH